MKRFKNPTPPLPFASSFSIVHCETILEANGTHFLKGEGSQSVTNTSNAITLEQRPTIATYEGVMFRLRASSATNNMTSLLCVVASKGWGGIYLLLYFCMHARPRLRAYHNKHMVNQVLVPDVRHDKNIG